MKTEPCFCRYSEQKDLQKLNNQVKTFVFPNSLNEYPLSLLIQVSFGCFSYQNLECHCLGNQFFYDGDKQGNCNGTRTLNHLVRKRTLNHFAKLA